MANVSTKTITRVRSEFSGLVDTPGVTAVTLNGEFVAVMIFPGKLPKAVGDRLARSLAHNPRHIIDELTRKATA